MIKIEVSEEIVNVPGKNGNNGWQKQVAYAHLPGQKYPVRITVTPKKGDPLYKPGAYNLAPESFYVGNFGELAVSPRLVAAASK